MSSHTCPWWLAWMLTTPLRRWIEDPVKILSPHVREGMRVLEPGPGMGYFTLELARLAGAPGRIYAVDVQERMLAGLRRRAARVGLGRRIETRLCTADDLRVADLAGTIDFALLWHMVHEVANQPAFFAAVFNALKPGATALFAEPRGHVAPDAYRASLAHAKAAGFEVAAPPAGKALRALLRRPPA